MNEVTKHTTAFEEPIDLQTNKQMAPNTETNTVEVWDRIQASESAKDFVEVTWSGKKLLLKRSQLDEWFHGKSFEDKVDYVRTHPFTVQIPVHKFESKFDPKEELFDPDDYVLIHWSGKDLLLEKNMLDKWYDMPYEMHDDYVRHHPDNVLDARNTDTSLVGMLDDEA